MSQPERLFCLDLIGAIFKAVRIDAKYLESTVNTQPINVVHGFLQHTAPDCGEAATQRLVADNAICAALASSPESTPT